MIFKEKSRAVSRATTYKIPLLTGLFILGMVTNVQVAAKQVKAGPIWNQADAEKKCTALARKHNLKWTGQWVTTVQGKMSVCELVSNSINYGQTVGIFSENNRVRLDIGLGSMKEEVPASHNSWATQFVIKRLDGQNKGPVSPDHVVGIFSKDGRVRLDIGAAAMKKEVPASHKSWATLLKIKRINGASQGPVRYGDVVGIFSENNRVRLDIGIRAVKKEIPANHESWATRLRIR